MFRHYEHPFFSVCVDVDVTSVWRRCHAPGGPSFFLTSLFLLTQAVNRTDAFRLRLRQRGVWLHDRVGVGTTILRPDQTFGFAFVEPRDSLDEFIADGKKAIALGTTQKKLTERPRDDVVYHSTLPWFRFTSFTNALRRNDCIPRTVFGKCSREGRALRMPVAVEVHHALVDGLDVAHFLERFEGELSAFR